jgi:hypothetical protein
MSCQIEVDGESMTEKIKPCPVCGASAEQSFDYAKCYNRDCAMSVKWQTIERWNNYRPVEDGLRGQLNKIFIICPAPLGADCAEGRQSSNRVNTWQEAFSISTECWRKFLANAEAIEDS